MNNCSIFIMFSIHTAAYSFIILFCGAINFIKFIGKFLEHQAHLYCRIKMIHCTQMAGLFITVEESKRQLITNCWRASQQLQFFLLPMRLYFWHIHCNCSCFLHHHKEHFEFNLPAFLKFLIMLQYFLQK